MSVSGHLFVTLLYCVVNVRDAPEKYQCIPEGVSIIRHESIMKTWDGG